MRPSALVFLALLVTVLPPWFLAVLPLHGQSTGLADRIAKEDVAARRKRAADRGLTDDEARRLGKVLDRLRPPPAGPVPRGLAEDTPGTFAGRLPWDEVQGVLAWTAEQPRAVLEIEVRAIAADPSRASFRVVLGQ